ncbi:MAG: peptide chain release factor N(5)-glutamine methyltransferase [Chloroflexi bacterium]|nr:peptide chain release factor N(5)-glutamine methyltransferase [Chloroflexota bacterium]
MTVTLREALSQAEASIAAEGIADPRIEAELLLMHSVGMGRAELYTRLGEPLLLTHAEGFNRLVNRRLRHEPTAYILGQCQFHGIDLHVDPRVLIPRPETELLVGEALAFAEARFPQGQGCRVADIGTGSGAVAVALALHLPRAVIHATDVSPGALEVARINCGRHGVGTRVQLLEGDLLQPLPEAVDLMVANLPYVRDSDLPGLIPEIREFEPMAALAAGGDGLEKIERLLPQAGGKLRPGGAVMLEIGQGQGPRVLQMARRHFPDAAMDLLPDLAGMDRVLRILA